MKIVLQKELLENGFSSKEINLLFDSFNDYGFVGFSQEDREWGEELRLLYDEAINLFNSSNRVYLKGLIHRINSDKVDMEDVVFLSAS